MKNAKRFAALLMAATMAVASLAACGKGNNSTPSPVPTKPSENNNNNTTTTPAPDKTWEMGDLETPQLTFTKDTLLRMACGYNNPNTGIAFDAGTAKDGITLADGKTYNTGDLKPTWAELEKRLGIKFEEHFTGAGSASKEFDLWKAKLGEIDMVAGSAATLTEFGVDGKLVNIAEYLDKMPNFKAYLEANPIVRLSITGDTKTGAIYFSPYFDGVDDIERMPLMRTDWVVKLLDGEGQFTAAASGTVKTNVYKPYMPTTGKVEVDVVKADGSAVEKVTKDYTAYGNIVEKMNAKDGMTGVEAVNMLREYIDKTYNGYYGNTRSALFCGQNAAWDADELVALLRCVVANAQTLNGTDTVYGLFSREDGNNQRRVDMFRFAGTLFGVRGLESRMDYLYLGTDGKLHDARSEADTYVAVERMNAMVQEGLISESFIKNDKDGKTETMLKNDLGFMHYDYNQTQTIFNQTALQDGEKYMAVMVPVARWFDGSNKDGVYMRFTESWRSVKTDGWAISKEGIGNDENKLNAALKLIDYAYSKKGMILMSYGPDAFIKTNADGSYVTFNFNGTQMPEIATATFAELWDKAKGNYTNYARYYLGSTLSFMKSQAFEYQCTHAVGKEGAGNISTAIALGTIKHPQLAITENPWYTSIPTVLPNTKVENDQLKGLTTLNEGFSTSKDKTNILVDIIAGGYKGEGLTSRDEVINTVNNSMDGKIYLALKQGAWTKLKSYYESK